jgi:uncharacterized membrane protein YqjE
MEATDSSASRKELGTAFRGVAQRLMIIGENRLELLTVEVQEERERLLHAFLYALAVAGCGMLASVTLTAAVVLALWSFSPVVVLGTLTVLYGVAGIVLLRRLTCVLQDWQSFPSSLDQLRKDRETLAKLVA